MTNMAFSVDNVIYTYPGFKLGPINLEVTPGKVLGLIGPNGAGKTTLLNCMVGLLRLDSGSITMFDRKVDINKIDWKFDVGYVSDEPVFYENWTGIKNLKFVSQFYPAWSKNREQELIDLFQCPVDKKAKTMSRGNRVKLGLIMALARSPKLLLLDEPTSGLDPVVRVEFLNTLWQLLEREDTTIVYSTHILNDIERIADDLIFLKNGKIILHSPKDELTEKWGRITYKSFHGEMPWNYIFSHESSNGIHSVITKDVNSTIAVLEREGATGIKHSRLSMEEVAVYILKGGHDVKNS